MSLPEFTSLSQLAPVKLAVEKVECPEWGVSFPVWEMTGDEVQEWNDGNTTTKNGRVVKTHFDTAQARLLMICLKNEAGERRFTLAEMKELCKRNASVVSRLERVALRLSGLDGDDDLKDAEGNSD